MTVDKCEKFEKIIKNITYLWEGHASLCLLIFELKLQHEAPRISTATLSFIITWVKFFSAYLILELKVLILISTIKKFKIKESVWIIWISNSLNQASLNLKLFHKLD